MINHNIIFEKDKLNKNKEEHFMLLELEGFHKKKKQAKQKDRQTLNISLVIDVSGSMGSPINNEFGYGHKLQNRMLMNTNQIIGGIPRMEQQVFVSPETKLDLVKKAAINAVNSMEYGDYISVISFHSIVQVEQVAVKLSKDNKQTVINSINNLCVSGMTNLHGGWLEGCKEVAKNKNEKFLNRVVLLTDGQVNQGETNSDVIGTDVLNVYKKGVSTSCFGVGNGFNEELLQDMSNSGGGNFYYIEKEEEFVKMFNEEFDGINNIAAFDVQIGFDLEEKFEIIENFNNLKKDGDVYLVPSIYKDSKMYILFNVKTKNLLIKDKTFGTLNIKYKNENSKLIEENLNLKIKVCKNKDWDNLEENEEMKVQEVLLTVAKRKEEATREIAAGNVFRAKEILSDSLAIVGSTSFDDQRLSAESALLNQTILDSDTKDTESLKKDIFYQSYKTRTNR